MSKIIAIQIRTLEVTANAVAVINKGIDAVQRVVNGGIDKTQAVVVSALNKRLDKLADEYLGQAAACTAAPYRQADALREQCDNLTAEFIEEGERRRAAYAKASTELINKQAECTSPAALAKAAAESDAIHKARVNLLARKK